jgi:hypothetical protein
MLDGHPPYGEFADGTSELSRSTSKFGSTNMPYLIKKAPRLAASDLTLLTERHLVALVSLVLNRLGEKTAAQQVSMSNEPGASACYHNLVKILCLCLLRAVSLCYRKAKLHLIC